jgi:methylphosphotriester-DNA--protein-cysteine methyltransferase
VDPAHLARAFRAHYGTTAGAYLRALRVRRATDALARSTAAHDARANADGTLGIEDGWRMPNAGGRGVGASTAAKYLGIYKSIPGW